MTSQQAPSTPRLMGFAAHRFGCEMELLETVPSGLEGASPVVTSPQRRRFNAPRALEIRQCAQEEALIQDWTPPSCRASVMQGRQLPPLSPTAVQSCTPRACATATFEAQSHTPRACATPRTCATPRACVTPVAQSGRTACATPRTCTTPILSTPPILERVTTHLSSWPAASVCSPRHAHLTVVVDDQVLPGPTTPVTARSPGTAFSVLVGGAVPVEPQLPLNPRPDSSSSGLQWHHGIRKAAVASQITCGSPRNAATSGSQVPGSPRKTSTPTSQVACGSPISAQAVNYSFTTKNAFCFSPPLSPSKALPGSIQRSPPGSPPQRVAPVAQACPSPQRCLSPEVIPQRGLSPSKMLSPQACGRNSPPSMNAPVVLAEAVVDSPPRRAQEGPPPEGSDHEGHDSPKARGALCSSPILKGFTGDQFASLASVLAPSSECLGFTWTKGRLLGQGAFGSVYEAFVPTAAKKGTFLAVKEISLQGPERQYAKELNALQKEVMVLRQVKHPNIVRYVGATFSDGVVHIFTEYMAGGSVSKMLKQFGPFGTGIVRRYTRHVLKGLTYLHRKRIMHRDLKGGNILINPQGRAKLADFGASRPIGDLVSASGVLKSKLVGSVYWMAPEVCTGKYGRYADIWSVGCTVLEMFLAAHPWPRFDSPLQAIKHIAQAGTPPPIPPQIPDVAQAFILLCCQLQPSQRPRAAELLSHQLVARPNEQQNSQDC